ncbi:MAG TPA: aquaporin [Candidatus Dormibacteraeota bacterium]|nr:aquaporin [Candidatus Dormibacteraeota bacterium]
MSPSLESLPLPGRALAELVGSALLLAAIVGSGIAAQRLSPQDGGLELLESSLATGAALAALILAVGPVSGAHLNPLVTLTDHLLGGVGRLECLVYWAAQAGGAVLGTILANLMFGLAPVELSTRARLGPDLWLSEGLATFGLLFVIFSLVRSRRATLVPFGAGAYITAAYWFTSSTSFANPAVTMARTLSNTFAGIAPGSVAPFLLAQLVGTGVAVAVLRLLDPGGSGVDQVLTQGTEPGEPVDELG